MFCTQNSCNTEVLVPLGASVPKAAMLAREIAIMCRVNKIIRKLAKHKSKHAISTVYLADFCFAYVCRLASSLTTMLYPGKG
jgi:hypothetical protein